MGGRGYTFVSSRVPEDEILDSFLHQYYREGRFIPDQVLLPVRVPDQSLLDDWLTDLKGRKVRVFVPERGEKKQLLEMACENAEKFLVAEGEVEKNRQELLELVKEKLHLGRVPRTIEAFDISNIQGVYAVGSMVSFEDGDPYKEGYRHFKIKSIEGADDYGMMYEVLYRRYKRALEEDDLPDLVLLDGGRGQLNVAQEVVKELGIKEADLISLAKERTVEGPHPSRFGKTEEKIFHPQYKEPLTLDRHSPLLHLLDRIRDEAHRFAVTYHKKMRGRETIKSVIEEIPGIGRVRQKELLRFFGSVERIKKATVEELTRAPRMNPKTAQILYGFFKKDPPQAS